MVNRNQEPPGVDAPEVNVAKGCGRSRVAVTCPRVSFAVLGLLTAEIDGVPASVDDVWAWGDRISEREWLDLIRDRSRAKPF